MNIIKELKKENNKESRKIMLDDLGLIRNITDKMNIYIMNTYDMQIVKRDLIGMAQEMKLRGTTLRDELGDDVDEFTKEIIENSRGPSKLEIFLYTLKGFAFYFIIYFVLSIMILPMDIGWTISLYFPAIIFIFISIITFIDTIFKPIFTLDKGIRRLIPVIIIIPFFILLNFLDLNEFIKTGPTINVIYLIIFFLIVYVISYFAYNKHIENLAKSSDNIVRDLIDKTK